MTDLFPEILQFNIPFIFILLIVLVSAGMGYFLYRKTNPKNSVVVRTVLALFRTILLLLIITLLFSPRIFYRFLEQKPKVVGFFIDHSASMALKSESESRIDSTQNVISLIKELSTSKDLNIQTFYFNQTVFASNEDTLPEPFGLTNFNNLKNFIENKNFDQVILVSDGIRTDGEMPQMNNDIKIYSIGVGNNFNDPDISILDVEYKPVVYQGKEQEVLIRLANKNVDTSSVRVMLYNSKNMIQQKNIEIDRSGVESELTLSYKPDKIGLQQFSVKIIPNVADSNSKNNTFVFTQEVVKSKIRVGIYSSVPNYEHKFLKFILSQSENINVYSYILIKNKKTSHYPVDSLDVIIFQDYPANNSADRDLDQIKSSLSSNGQGFILLPGKKTNIQKLKRFIQFLPVSDILARRRILTGNYTSPDLNYQDPLISLFDKPEQNIDFWNNLPPVQIKFSVPAKEKSKILLEINSRIGKENGLIILEKNQSKSAVVNGIGLWNWHFSFRNDENYKDGYKYFILNLVRWSANKTKFKPVVLKTNKNTIHPGQQIIFEGYMYSAQNKAVINGRMGIEAFWKNQKFSIDMESDSSGVYRARYTPGGEGSYSFIAKAFAGDKVIGSAKQTVEVIPYNREFIQTDLDSIFLKRLSESSDGVFLKAKQTKDIFDYLDLSYDKIRIENEIELRYKAWLLYFIIGLAVLEWVVRKKNSLV